MQLSDDNMLHSTILAQKSAFEALNDDFVEYQEQAEQNITQLKHSFYQTQSKLELEKQFNEELEQKNMQLQQKLAAMQQAQAVQQSELQQQKINYQSLLQNSEIQKSNSLQQIIVENEAANRSELQFVKLAYNTKLSEIQLVKTQLLQEQEIQQQLQQQVKDLKTQCKNQEIPQDIANLYSENKKLRETLYKSQTLIAALGCPFDVFKNEVIEKIRTVILDNNTENYCNTPIVKFQSNQAKDFSSQSIKETTLDQQIYNLVNRGLYLMGMKIQVQDYLQTKMDTVNSYQKNNQEFSQLYSSVLGQSQNNDLSQNQQKLKELNSQAINQPWRNLHYVGAPEHHDSQFIYNNVQLQNTNNAVNTNQQVIKQTKEYLGYSFETFKTLIRKCEILELKNVNIELELQQVNKQLEQLNQKNQIINNQNDKLQQLNIQELNIHKQVNQQLNSQNQFLLKQIKNFNSQLSQFRNQQLIQLNQFSNKQNDQQQIIKNLQKYQSITEQLYNHINNIQLVNVNIDILDQSQLLLNSQDLDVSQNSKDYNSKKALDVQLVQKVFQQLNTFNVQPVVYNVEQILQKDYGVILPPNILQYFDNSFIQIVKQQDDKLKINSNLLNITLLMLLEQNKNQIKQKDMSKINLSQSQLQKSSKFGSRSEKLTKFNEQFMQLVNGLTLTNQEIQEFYQINCNQDDVSNKYLTELNNEFSQTKQQLEQLQKQLENKQSTKQVYQQDIETIIKQIQIKTDLQTSEQLIKQQLQQILMQTNQQNKSQRYLSFLEIFNTLLLQYISTNLQNVASITNQLSSSSSKQIQQLKLFETEFQQIKQLYNQFYDNITVYNKQIIKYNNSFEDIKQIYEQLVQKVPQQLLNINNYTIQMHEQCQLLNTQQQQFESNNQNLFKEIDKQQKDILINEQQQKIFKQISSQLLDFQTKLTQFQDFTVQDRELLHQYINQQKSSDKQYIQQLRNSFTQSEIKRKKNEQEACQVRQFYSQLASQSELKYEQYETQIMKLRNQLQKEREEQVVKLRNQKQELLQQFQNKQILLEQQIKLLRDTDICAINCDLINTAK